MKNPYVTQPFYCLLISMIFFLFGNIALGQTLTSDKDDYAPGTTVTLTGSGFQAGETVRMQVLHYDVNGDNDTSGAHAPWDIVAGGAGNFVTTWVVPADEDELGATLMATADGQSSELHAEALFTDAEDQPPECIVISSAGNDTTILLPAVPVFTPPTAIDACDSPVWIIVVLDETTPGSFPGTYSRTICWVATDGSANESEVVCQTINVTTDTTSQPCTPPIATASNNGPLCAGGTLNLSSTGESALPQLTPDFGTAANYILFTTAGAVSNTSISQITGNIGTNAGAITGFENSTVTGSSHIADAVTAQCSADLLTAYNVLYNTAATNTSHAPAFGSGETVFPGVYSTGGAGSVAGNLTLDAQGDPNAIFIFKTGGAFTTGASTTIILTNGAAASNVFWVAEGAVAMAAATTMKGTLIANNGAISMGAGGSLEGRMYSTTGAASVYAVTAFIPVDAYSLVTYSWTGPNGFTSSLQNPGISNVTVEATGTYTVTVTNSTGCSTTASTSVTVNASPAPTITGNSVVCSGEASTLDAGAGYAGYVWSTGATTQTISVSTAGTYTVTVTNSSACSGSTSLTLTVNANPSPAITGNNICSGAAATLDAGAGYSSYLWSTGATSQTISVNTAGTYTVTVTNASGCSATATTSVTSGTNPTATASSNSPVSGGNTLNLTSSGGTSYSWTGPNGFVSTLQNPSIPGITYLAAGIYTVVVTNSYGCTAIATTTVVTNCAGFRSYTITQGGWGATANGNNPAVYRNANFPYAFPTGLTIGCGSYWLSLTTSLAVQNFLPSGGSPSVLTQSYMNPGSSLSNTFAAQVTALALNVGFDNYDATFAATSVKLKDLFVKSGTFMGWTVQQVLDEAQKKLGGCSSIYTASQLSTACADINENYDNGNTDKGYLNCQPLRIANVPSVPEANTLKLYPNPTNGEFLIEMNLDEAITASVDIQVFNMLGQIIYVNRTNAIDGMLRQELKLDNSLPNGNYLVRVISGQEVFSEQVVYQK